jgi:hypothetical protein
VSVFLSPPWIAVILAALALIVALAAMVEVRTAKRRVGARDRAIEHLTKSVERLERGRAQSPGRSSPANLQPVRQDVEGRTSAQAEDQAIASSPVPVPTEVSVVVPPDAPNAGQVLGEYGAVSEEVTPPYSVNHVLEVYTRWCTDRKRPSPTNTMEIASLQYDGKLESGDGRSRHRLKDASQLAEFVRFSEPGSLVGVVLPDPDAHFTPVVAYLFPGLTRADYGQSSLLSGQAPVQIKRATSSQWEVV